MTERVLPEESSLQVCNSLMESIHGSILGQSKAVRVPWTADSAKSHVPPGFPLYPLSTERSMHAVGMPKTSHLNEPLPPAKQHQSHH